MVVYDLACPLEHHFEGWFESAATYEAQREGGHVSCPLCNSKEITRLPSAPYLRGAGDSSATDGERQPMMMVAGDLVAALRRQVVQQVLALTEDVGDAFPDIVRDMHYGDTEARNVRGVATPEALEKLYEEGIDVMVLAMPDTLGSTH